jgi:hypothetical protein
MGEKLSNPDFKPLEFDRFRRESGNNYFVLSSRRWIESTNAIGFISKSVRYGGTYAHKDVAFEFVSCNLNRTIWERLNNSYFKPVEFDGIRMQAGLNSFTLDGYELKTLDGFLKGLRY